MLKYWDKYLRTQNPAQNKHQEKKIVLKNVKSRCYNLLLSNINKCVTISVEHMILHTIVSQWTFLDESLAKFTPE